MKLRTNKVGLTKAKQRRSLTMAIQTIAQNERQNNPIYLNKTPFLSRIGFFINKQLLNTRVLAGSIAAVSLTAISTVFNYQFGVMLAGNDSVSQVLLPLGYAALDVGALFIGGYIGLYAKQYISKLVGFIWLCVLIGMSLFTAWSFQCATDHKNNDEGKEQVKIALLQQQIQRYQSSYDQSIKEKNATRYHDQKTKYQLEADEANAMLEQKTNELISIQNESFKPQYAVFYKTPILRNAPEQNMILVRFVFSAAIIFTPFVILYLMGIEAKKQTVTQSKTADISAVFDDGINSSSGGGDDIKSATKNSLELIENILQELEHKKDFRQQYIRIKKRVIEGKIKPSYRQIETKGGIGSKYTKAILHKLEKEKITIRNGQGWKVNATNNSPSVDGFAKNNDAISNVIKFNSVKS